MKKTLSLILALIMAFGVTAVAFAADNAEVYVAIADNEGRVRLAYEAIAVNDADKDGKLTINDALICAHDAGYPGGAKAGFGTYETQWGLSIYKLWGIENNNSFMYYLNDGFANGLFDPVKEGDYLYAFAMQDKVGFSDTYAFFNQKTVEGKNFTEVEITLQGNFYNTATFALELAPIEGAEITIDGAKTGVFTDAEGKATVNLGRRGEHVISAVGAEGSVITPPVCKAGVSFSVFAAIRYAVVTIYRMIVDLFKK